LKLAEDLFQPLSKVWVQVTAGAEQTIATASIDASLTASNDAVDAVHTYVVVSIGVNLIASTAATGFALLREHSAINAMTTAQKEAINAASTATLVNLAADLTGRNASESLDDPIAIAAATNNAAQSVKAAWQNVNNLQARAASTFAGTGPGGFAMTFAGFMGGVGDTLGIIGASWAGIQDGFWMTLNAATFHQFHSLDNYVDGVIEANGGSWSLYGAGNFFGHIGAYAAEAAGFLVALEYFAGQGLYTVSNHAVERLIERQIYPAMIRWTISGGSRFANVGANRGLWSFLTTARHIAPAMYHGSQGAVVVVRNIWTNNIVTVMFTSSKNILVLL